MNGTTIDTLELFEELKQSFTEEQAHTLSKTLKRVEESRLDELASKRDLREAVNGLEARMIGEMKEQELRLTVRFGGMLTVAVAIIVMLDKLL